MSGLDQFKETYITECSELLEEMEERLLNINEGETDLEELNAIFRCAHSIKGGGGAFGFDSLVKFTHNVEALLDAIREGAIVPTQDIIDTLLKSVDVISSLVAAAQSGDELPSDFGDDITDSLKVAIDASGGEVVEMVSPPTKKQESEECYFFDVSFIPHRTLFESGNEPLLIIRELHRIGEVTSVADISKIPVLSEMDHEECYISWQIDVSTNKGIDGIKEAFEFVEDECDLDIDEFGAISMPSQEDVDLSDDDEFGGVFMDALHDVQEGRKDEPVKEVSKTPAPQHTKIATVSSIRVDVEKVDRLVNMVGELVITQAMITEQTNGIPSEKFHKLIEGVEELTRHVRELQEAIMSVRMQPVKSIFARMPRIVRDLSRQLGKDIRIEMSGENTEIDKTVIEQLGDPLTHMIRNSVDHGIESPEIRKKKGKFEQGVIKLSADNSGGRIIIEIADDGNGIDREKVLAKAKERGLVQSDGVLSDEEIDHLIFRPGFSTADEVTNVSGRGVGMDVVSRNIADLGGTIDMRNDPDEGSSFSVSLPLTLAILDGMIVQVGSEYYIIPITNILESLSPSRDDIKSITSGSDVINVRGEYIPILYLHEIFTIPNANTNTDKPLVILVESGRDRIGLVVDDIIRQQQVVIKSLEENSDPVDGVSGATILGDGNVSLILDIVRLRQMTVESDDMRAA